MRPAFSVLLLTTLIGAAQGLFIVLSITELLLGSSGEQAYSPLLACGGGIAAVLSVIGLLASFFHLGHPMRAWRAVAGWRTSWLSREVIVLPAFIAAAAAYALLHLLQPGSYLGLGQIGSLLAIALFVCTGMIYAAVKAIREWASSLTVINFTLMGLASGTTLAAALATLHAPELARLYAVCAVALSAIAAIGHFVAQARIRQLAPAATMQSAIGVRHPKVTQRSQGAMGGSFNTREWGVEAGGEAGHSHTHATPHAHPLAPAGTWPSRHFAAVPLAIPAAHLGIFLTLTGADPLRQASDLRSFGALQSQLRHGDRPVMVGNHHHDEMGIGGTLTHRHTAPATAGRHRGVWSLGDGSSARGAGARLNCARQNQQGGCR